jgi:hypothetical protein
MGGSSAPAGASGIPSNTGPAAQAYQPTAQPTSDIGFQQLAGGLFSNLGPAYAGATGFPFPFNDLGTNAFAWTPGGVAYPQSTAWTGAGSVTDPNNPLLQQGITAAQSAYGGYSPLVAQLAGLVGPGSESTSGAQTYAQMLSQGYAPTAFGQGATNIANANTIGQPTFQLNQGANALLTNQSAPTVGQDILNASMYQVGPSTGQATIDANTLTNYGNSILNTGFDPQNALYNQLQNQVSQQAQAANAAAGLGGSAYGASNTGNTLSNFDINWQNQQLARQQAALGSAEPAFTTAQGLVPSTLSAFGNAANTGEGLTAAPYQLGGQIAQGIGNLLTTAGNLGNLGLSQGLSGAQQFYTGAQAPFETGLAQATGTLPSYQGLATLGGAPYSAQATGAGNAQNLLGQTVNIGNQQYVLPQQLMNDLQSYLGLGQAASGLSGQLGALGQQESLASMAGLGSALGTGSNLLFGNSLGGSGGLLGAAGLNPFTSSAGALGASDFGGSIGSVGAAAGPTFADAAGGAFGGGDLAAVGAADAGASAGGGGALASLLPFGAS